MNFDLEITDPVLAEQYQAEMQECERLNKAAVAAQTKLDARVKNLPEYKVFESLRTKVERAVVKAKETYQIAIREGKTKGVEITDTPPILGRDGVRIN